MQNERAGFFATDQWTGGVIGLGYVGLPLAVTMVQNGLKAIGYDQSQQRIDMLNRGVSPVEDISDKELAAALASGLEVTADPSRLNESDAIFICVPSPLGRHREPDLSFIQSAADVVADVVKPGMLVSLESTTYPGTTEDILVPAVSGKGLVVDEDVFVAFSPERVSPGAEMKTGDIPKVVGGVSAVSTDVAAAAYSRVVASVHPVSSARAAEMAKLLENTYRAVNIGLINEMAQLAHELDISIWEVVDAAGTKPFGFQAFYPGPGVGGHCIPLDPQFLAWRAKEANFSTRFIDLAEQVNTKMPVYAATRVADLLNHKGLPVFGTRILGVGIAYKPDVADDRESASIEVLRELEHRGAEIAVLDPIVGKSRIESHGFAAVDADAPLDDYAVAVLLTDHAALDLEKIADEVPTILDTRGAFRRAGIERDNVEAL
ncbi:MAG: nucleotide sugar dehydrogenase [bacterium]|nr:nucleotide sugar dehydrogenase [bacterium]MCP4968365.1 nucleotide sugar dehydrogenase [bacterium]